MLCLTHRMHSFMSICPQYHFYCFLFSFKFFMCTFWLTSLYHHSKQLFQYLFSEDVRIGYLYRFNGCGPNLLVTAALKGATEVTHHMAARRVVFMDHDTFCLHAVKHGQPCCSHDPHKNSIRSNSIVSYTAHWIVQ